MLNLQNDDPAMAALIDKERLRLEETLDLIAAENHAPASIMETLGSVFNTKTIEGYPGHRYHAGCTYADEVERLAISRCQSLFGFSLSAGRHGAYWRLGCRRCDSESRSPRRFCHIYLS